MIICYSLLLCNQAQRKIRRKHWVEVLTYYWLCFLLTSFSDNKVYLMAKLQTFDLISTKEKHPCPKCNRIFEKKSSLSRHLTYMCGKRPQFKCPYCEYCCNMRCNVYRHVRYIHKKNEVYALDIIKNCVTTPYWLFYALLTNYTLTDLFANFELKKTVKICYAYFIYLIFIYLIKSWR